MVAVVATITVIAALVIHIVIDVFAVILVVIALGMPTPVPQNSCTKGNLWFLEFHAGIDAI